MKNIFIFIISFLLIISCNKIEDCSKDIVIAKDYSGTGLLLSFSTNQDGVGDFWFFPTCLDSNKNNSSIEHSNLKYGNFKKGILFKLPLSGTYYSKIKNNFIQLNLDSTSFFPEVWYVPVSISFQKIISSTLNDSLYDQSFKLQLENKKLDIEFNYFQVYEINISNLKVIEFH